MVSSISESISAASVRIPPIQRPRRSLGYERAGTCTVLDFVLGPLDLKLLGYGGWGPARRRAPMRFTRPWRRTFSSRP